MNPEITSATVIPNNNKARYALAKASNRIFARVIDAIIILTLVGSLALCIIATDPAGIKSALELQQTWRYLIMSLVALIAFTIYFILVPYFTNGRTIGLLIFKLRIYNLISTKNFAINLIKRECLLWIVVCVTNLALGISLCVMNSANAASLLKQILLYQKTNDTSNQASVAIFQALYAISALLLLFAIVHMCICNGRRCFIDHISDTVVVKLVDTNGKDSNASKNVKTGRQRRNYGLPGEIMTGAESEIDSL